MVHHYISPLGGTAAPLLANHTQRMVKWQWLYLWWCHGQCPPPRWWRWKSDFPAGHGRSPSRHGEPTKPHKHKHRKARSQPVSRGQEADETNWRVVLTRTTTAAQTTSAALCPCQRPCCEHPNNDCALQGGSCALLLKGCTVGLDGCDSDTDSDSCLTAIVRAGAQWPSLN